MSVVGALGVAGYAGILLTPPTMSAPVFILTLAVADSVHLLDTFFRLLNSGMEKTAAMIESLRINRQALFITSATTAIGFLSMNFSESPPFHDLGNITAIGVMMAFLLSVSFLPAFMLLLPLHQAESSPPVTRLINKVADFVIRRHKPLVWGLACVVLLLSAFISRNELNDNFVEYFDKSVRFRRDTDFVSQHLTGLHDIQYSIQAADEGGVSDPAYLQLLEDFAHWYRQQPGVVHVNVISDIMKRLNRNLHGDKPAWNRLPQQRDLAAQYLLLYEMSLPYGLDLTNQINLQKSASRMIVTLRNPSSNELLLLVDRAKIWLQQHAPGIQAEGSGPSVMFSRVGARNINSMLIGTVVALILISVILILAFRSLKIGLISLIPNLAPAAMAFGLWGIWVGEVGLSLAVVVGLTLGIVVDDTVHFLSKYLRARREQGLSAEAAVRYAFSTVGNALFITSVVLACGFMILTLSSFTLNSATGLLTAITIVLALITDFFLLPGLLLMLDRPSGVRT
ncbi:MAG: MMPL family transporter [gamma proteobacterium symbiont of Bathyaustriella thionipta]|nr:MMPL family transporter [gamma proteobacterium symbiont of Bathyaustriella thionipta]